MSIKKWTQTDIELTSEFLKAPHFTNDPGGHQIMHEWETPIMRQDAKRLCEGGGSILNIGYGMGIIDGFIRDHKPDKHTIIEVHPQIVENAKAAGYENVLEGDWLDVVKNMTEQFDAIYFDTYCFDRDDWAIFTKDHADRLLKPGGRYSYFNAGAARHQKVAELCEAKGWKSSVEVVRYSRTNSYDSIIWHKPAK